MCEWCTKPIIETLYWRHMETGTIYFCDAMCGLEWYETWRAGAMSDKYEKKDG